MPCITQITKKPNLKILAFALPTIFPSNKIECHVYDATTLSIKACMDLIVTQSIGRGPEQRESEKTVLYLQIIIILIGYNIIYYY